MSESKSIPTLAALQRSAHEYLKNSQWVAARQVLLQAAQHYADSADVFSDLAAAERALGQLDQAILHYQRSLELDPKLAFVHNNLGDALSEKGQLRDAVDCYHRALVLQPRYPEALNNLAKVLLREGRLDESRRALERLFGMTRDHLPAFETLAVLCERQGNVQEALQHYTSLASHYLKGSDPERALWAMESCRRLGHRSAGLEANRCAAFLQLGRFDEARDAGISALRLDPNHANAHVNLGSAYVSLGDYRSALTLQKRATELSPNLAEAFVNLGNTLVECDDPQNALIAQNRALELDPNNPRAMCGLAVCYQTLGRRLEAADLYRRALSVAPTFAEAHYKYGRLLLSEGQLPEGFKELEWRRSEPIFRNWAERYPGPMWSGQEVTGKTVVLYDDQGSADVILFARYASAFKQRGARVVVDCRTPLHRLLSCQSFIDGVTDSQETGAVSFDSYAPLQSLPHVFGTTISSIPGDHPYLQAPSSGPADATLSQASGVKIGVAWKADPEQPSVRQRSMDLDQLEPLFDVPGVSWFSLQVGAGREQLQRAVNGPVDLGANFSDFADCAAAISKLDLIITVDSSIAHLAGALGRPVWVLLPQQADWRWHLEREDSPWYPRARLFRQQVSAWEPLVSSVRQQLIQSLAAFAKPANDSIKSSPGEGRLDAGPSSGPAAPAVPGTGQPNPAVAGTVQPNPVAASPAGIGLGSTTTSSSPGAPTSQIPSDGRQGATPQHAGLQHVGFEGAGPPGGGPSPYSVGGARPGAGDAPAPPNSLGSGPPNLDRGYSSRGGASGSAPPPPSRSSAPQAGMAGGAGRDLGSASVAQQPLGHSPNPGQAASGEIPLRAPSPPYAAHSAPPAHSAPSPYSAPTSNAKQPRSAPPAANPPPAHFSPPAQRSPLTPAGVGSSPPPALYGRPASQPPSATPRPPDTTGRMRAAHEAPPPPSSTLPAYRQPKSASAGRVNPAPSSHQSSHPPAHPSAPAKNSPSTAAPYEAGTIPAYRMPNPVGTNAVGTNASPPAPPGAPSQPSSPYGNPPGPGVNPVPPGVAPSPYSATAGKPAEVPAPATNNPSHPPPPPGLYGRPPNSQPPQQQASAPTPAQAGATPGIGRSPGAGSPPVAAPPRAMPAGAPAPVEPVSAPDAAPPSATPVAGSPSSVSPAAAAPGAVAPAVPGVAPTAAPNSGPDDPTTPPAAVGGNDGV